VGRCLILSQIQFVKWCLNPSFAAYATGAEEGGIRTLRELLGSSVASTRGLVSSSRAAAKEYLTAHGVVKVNQPW
jgi:hypothetical protein